MNHFKTLHFIFSTDSSVFQLHFSILLRPPSLCELWKQGLYLGKNSWMYYSHIFDREKALDVSYYRSIRHRFPTHPDVYRYFTSVNKLQVLEDGFCWVSIQLSDGEPNTTCCYRYSLYLVQKLFITDRCLAFVIQFQYSISKTGNRKFWSHLDTNNYGS